MEFRICVTLCLPLNGTPLERLLNTLVSLFPLGHTISPPLICARLKMILGLLYQQYYNHAEGDVLKQLYIPLVRPHLEYGCAVWDPYTLKSQQEDP